MQQFNFDTIKEVLNPVKFIEQAEKNTQAVLAYVEPKELSKTLVTLTSDYAAFARAQIEAVESIAKIVQKQAEDFTKNYAKVAK